MLQARRVEAVVLRRTAEVNKRFLPPLATFIVFCRPSPLQACTHTFGYLNASLALPVRACLHCLLLMTLQRDALWQQAGAAL